MSKVEPTTTSEESTMGSPAPTVSSIPSLHAFDSRTTTWQSYRDRISFYFKANRIITDDDKKALFLWAVGDKTYQLLESLVSPQLLTGEETTFTELIELLDSHYDATKNIMTSTFDFYSCYQKPGQSFAEWKAELCSKLRHCNFTSSTLSKKPQERALRDMYVIGIKIQKIRQALLKEQDPDLETTEKIIQRAERLEEDVRHFGSAINQNDFTVAKIHNNQHKRPQQQPRRNNQPTKNDLKSCDSCGGTNHARSECKYRDFVCNSCKKKGHLERICRQRQETISTNYISTIYKLNYANSNVQSDQHSLTVSFKINGHGHLFQLDTGTWNTIINIADWCKIGSPPIQSSKWKLKCYSGTMIRSKGECLVHVEYDKQTFQLPVLVVNDTSPSLLGLQWIYQMNLDLNRVISGSCSANMIKPTKPTKPLQQTRFIVGQLVWQLKPQLNKRSTWQPGIIIRQIGSMLYEIQSSDGQRSKRHQNQLRHRYRSDIESSETNSLPDDLQKTASHLPTPTIQPSPSTSPTTQLLPSTSPRYPRRNRRPPDHYSPTN